MSTETERPAARWATARETCAHLRVSLPTLYRRTKDALLPPPADFGGVKRWNLAAIDAHLTARAEATAAKAALERPPTSRPGRGGPGRKPKAVMGTRT